MFFAADTAKVLKHCILSDGECFTASVFGAKKHGVCNTNLADAIAMEIVATPAPLARLLGSISGEVLQGLGHLWFAKPAASIFAHHQIKQHLHLQLVS